MEYFLVAFVIYLSNRPWRILLWQLESKEMSLLFRLIKNIQFHLPSESSVDGSRYYSASWQAATCINVSEWLVRAPCNLMMRVRFQRSAKLFAFIVEWYYNSFGYEQGKNDDFMRNWVDKSDLRLKKLSWACFRIVRVTSIIRAGFCPDGPGPADSSMSGPSGNRWKPFR